MMAYVGAFFGSLVGAFVAFQIFKLYAVPFIFLAVFIFIGGVLWGGYQIGILIWGLIRALYYITWGILKPMNILRLLSLLISSPLILPFRRSSTTPGSGLKDVPVVSRTPPAIKAPQKAAPVSKEPPKFNAKNLNLTYKEAPKWVPHASWPAECKELTAGIDKGTMLPEGFGFEDSGLFGYGSWVAGAEARDGTPLVLVLDPEEYQSMVLHLWSALKVDHEKSPRVFQKWVLDYYSLLGSIPREDFEKDYMEGLPAWKAAMLITRSFGADHHFGFTNKEINLESWFNARNALKRMGVI